MAGVACIVLLARHMQVNDYARFATIAGVAATIGLLSSIGLEKAVTCYLPLGRMTQPGPVLGAFVWRVLGLRVAVLLAFTAALAILWPVVGGTGALPGDVAILGAGWIVSTNVFQFLALILQCLVQQTRLSAVLIAQWSIRLAMLAAVLSQASGMSLTTGMIIMAGPELAGCVLLVLALKRHLQQLAASADSTVTAGHAWPIWRDVRKLMQHNYGYAWLIALPQPNAMIVAAALVLAVPQVAAYGFFASIVERLKAYLPLQFMLNLAEPVLIAGYARDHDFTALWQRAGLLYKVNVVLLVLLLAWTAAVAPILTRLLAGERYATFAWLLPLLVAQVAFGSLNTILQVIVNSVGCSAILTRSGSIALGAMVVCFAGGMLAGRSGTLLLATPLIFELANSAVTLHLLDKRGYTCRWDALFHLKVVAAGCFACFSALQLKGWANGWLEMFVTGAVALAVFALCGMLLRLMQPVDIATLATLMQRTSPGRR
jgi:O-antigen/teichoic acid export membrane protein